MTFATLLAHALPAQPAQPATARMLIDAADTGLAFQGAGAISASSSRLLYDYPEPERSQILDYLLSPACGGKMQILKVEIGGDMNSTDLAEPSHMRVEGKVDDNLGFEWWLMAEAMVFIPAHITGYHFRLRNDGKWEPYSQEIPRIGDEHRTPASGATKINPAQWNRMTLRELAQSQFRPSHASRLITWNKTTARYIKFEAIDGTNNEASIGELSIITEWGKIATSRQPALAASSTTGQNVCALGMESVE